MATEEDEAPAPPPVPESPLERQIRTMAAAVERFAEAAGLPPAGGGGPRSPTRGPTVDELVRASTDPSVVKSRNDENYTALEEGWFGDPSRYGHTDSRHHDRGLFPLTRLPEDDDDETRFKARMIIDFHRERGRKLTVAEASLPEDGYVPTREQREHPEKPVYRLPQPPRKGTSYSELQRKETSAQVALGGRCWDPRWSWSYNVEQLMLILSTHFKQTTGSIGLMVVTYGVPTPIST